VATFDEDKGQNVLVAAIADIPSPGSATAPTCAAKINELLAALRAAGVIALD
jgi:hypothetical protein